MSTAPGDVLLRLRLDDDVAAQLRPWMFRWGPVQILYWSCNLLALATIVVLGWRSADRTLAYSHACLGMALAYAILLPPHEWIHAAAYRGLGHARVAITYRWRTLSAFCTADQAVLTGPQFAWVCIAPSAILNPLLLVALVASHSAVQMLLSGALLLHLAAASGDIGLLGLVWHYRGQGLRTRDDLERQETLFWRQVGAG